MIVGVDPGVDGALALLDASGRLIEVVDMPTIQAASKRQPSAVLIRLQLREWHATSVFIEKVTGGVSRPKGDKMLATTAAAGRSSGGFNFGFGAGAIYGLCLGMDLDPRMAPPATWKRAMKVTADKETSRAMALQLWPHMAASFKFKKNENRAEAALIGLYGVQHLTGPLAVIVP